MGQKSSVDKAEMARAAQQVEATAQDLQQLRGQLGQEQTQLSGSWAGQGSEAFTQVYNKFDNALGKLLVSLNRLHESLVQAKINYAASDQEQAVRLNRVAGLING